MPSTVNVIIDINDGIPSVAEITGTPNIKVNATIRDSGQIREAFAPLVDQIRVGIQNGTLTQADVLIALSEAGAAKNFPKHIEDARLAYVASDDVEIDDQPLVSESEGEGVWVSAWIFVSNSDVED